MGDNKGSGRLRRTRKFIRIFLFALILLALALFFCSLGDRNEYYAPQFNATDASAATDVIMRLSRAMVDRDSRPVETVRLRLRRNEVQMLVNTMIRSSNRSGREFLPYAALWDDGFFRIHCSMPVFGNKAVNLYLEITPSVENGRLSLVPGRGSAGHLPLPRSVLRGIADRIAGKLMRNESARTALSAFILLEPRDDGSLLVMFDPRDMNAVINLLRSAKKPPAPDKADAAEPAAVSADEPADVSADEPAAVSAGALPLRSPP